MEFSEWIKNKMHWHATVQCLAIIELYVLCKNFIIFFIKNKRKDIGDIREQV